MYRRAFIKNSTISLIASTGFINWTCKNPPVPDNLIDQLIHALDDQVPGLLASQIKVPTHTYFGGLPDTFQIYHPGSVAGFIQSLTIAYISPASKYFHDPLLQQAMMDGIEFLLRAQHSDGTIDLLTTNFHSTPDTAFAVEPLALSYKLLASDLNPIDELRNKIKSFLIRAGEALSIGGIHTPNHRWVVCMALSRLNDLFPKPDYAKRIETWLAEGIDIDADGQYTERSTSVYSPLTDRCLITMARLMKKPELYEPVRKNLDMTLYYLHPNGEIVTETSLRQDQYYARHAEEYYYPYWYMSIQDHNTIYYAMKNWIEQDMGINKLTGILPYLLEDAGLNAPIRSGVLPVRYEKFFSASALIRWRQDDVDATILAKNSTLFSFHHQNAILQALRLSSAFFGKGQFIPDLIVKTSTGYLLTQKLEGPYFQPFPSDSITGDGNWKKMPRDKRPKSEVQTLNYSIDFTLENNSWSMDIKIEGTAEVPVAVELSFRTGGKLSNVKQSEESEDIYLLTEGEGQYLFQGSGIEFGPGKNEHNWTQLRGAEPRIPGLSVYLTGFTPFRHQLKITPINL